VPTYQYRAIDRAGKTYEATESAGSPDELRELLAGRQQFLVEHAEVRGGEAERGSTGSLGSIFGAGVSERELALLAWQVHTMLAAGLPLLKTLDLLARQSPNLELRAALASVCTDISRGDDLSLALSRQAGVFSPLFCSMIETGETAGNLDVTMRRLAEYLDRSSEIRDKLVGAVAYPLMLVTMCGAVTLFLMIFVMPRLSQVFADSGVALPMLTQVLVWTGGMLGRNLLWLGLAAVAVAVLVSSWVRTPRGAEFRDRLLLQLPVVGELTLKSVMGRLVQTLSTLQLSGISTTASLEIVERTIGNSVVAAALRRVHAGVTAGESLSSELRKSGLFPELISTMVAVGEETGAVGAMLSRIAEVYAKEFEFSVASLTRILEPILLVGMTVVVGLIAASIYLPIADLSSTVGR
jgi:type II secretory pathway component PulF